ncbi:hypothetical protein ES705_33265 [subsurface metagenome]
MIGQVSVAAATAIAGYDLFKNETWRVSAKPRRIRGMGVAGSTAALDCSVDLFVDQFHVGKFYNSAPGAVIIDQHMVPLKGNLVPPGATISCIVGTAPTTNPINILII